MNALTSPVLSVVVYLRVSTEQQAKEGYSLPEQKELCRKKAQALAKEYEKESGQPVQLQVVEFVDDFGGDVVERPVLERVREYVRENRPAFFVSLDPDRFSRSLKLQLIVADDIESQGTRLAFVMQDYDPDDFMSKAFFQFRGLMAELDKAKIIANTSRGKKGKLKAGKRANSACPYGYRINKETKDLEVHEPEAIWVRQMFDWVLHENMGVYSVTDRLNELGVPTRQGKGKWYRSVVREVLRNTTYVGRMRCNRQDTKGLGSIRRLPREKRRALSAKKRPESEWVYIPQPVIIPQDVFDQVQERLKTTTRRGGRRDTGLLSMLCQCGVCGGRMGYARHPGRTYLYCFKRYAKLFDYAPDTPHCTSPHHRAEAIEQGVWNQLTEWLLNPDLLAKHIKARMEPERQAATTVTLNERIASMESQMASKKQEQAEIVRKQFAGLLSQDVGDAMLKELVAQVNNLEAALSEAKRDLARLQSNTSSSEEAVRRFRQMAEQVTAMQGTFADTLAGLSAHSRREVVLKLVKRVVIDGDGTWDIITY